MKRVQLLIVNKVGDSYSIPFFNQENINYSNKPICVFSCSNTFIEDIDKGIRLKEELEKSGKLFLFDSLTEANKYKRENYE